jgi:uncharacterized protein (TIGR02594 family)
MALTRRQIVKAVRYNRRNASRLGWLDRYARILWLLGLARAEPDAQQFAQALAAWQGNEGLEPDGMLGPTTWGVMEPRAQGSGGTGRAPTWLQPAGPPTRPNTQRVVTTPPPPAAAGGEPRWIQIARAQRQRWDEEIAGWNDASRARNAEAHLDWDEAYFVASPRWGRGVHAIGHEKPSGRRSNIDWCAAFVNYCLHTAGVSHTGSAGAASFRSNSRWTFEMLEEPRVGCVLVVGNNDTPAHVGFLVGWEQLRSSPRGNVRDGRGIRLLGGNQRGERITVKIERRDLLAPSRSQGGVRTPYLWPQVGIPNCNITLPTEQGHHCHHIHTARDIDD